MSKTLAILGAGALGQQIAHFALQDSHFEKVVFFDDFSNEKETGNIPILGNSDAIEKKYAEGLFDELLIGIGYHHLDTKKSFYEKFKETIPFATLIHPTVWVDPTAIIAKGCVVYPNSCLDQRVEIGENTLINLSVTIAHDSKVGAHSFLSPSVAIAGFCTLGEQNFLGIQTTVIDNIQTCHHVSTGGGSVVVKNILEPGTYFGVPVKKIKNNDSI